MPAFSTENESGQGWGRASVGPGMIEAFVVGIGVGGVVGSGVGDRVGIGVPTGCGGGDEQPATVRRTARARTKDMIIRNFMMGLSPASI